MNRRRGIRSLCRAALAVTAVSLSSSLLAAEAVKIDFLVKQAEEPWFQTEWAFAEKAAKDKGFTLIKIAVDRKSTRLNSSHLKLSRMPSSA